MPRLSFKQTFIYYTSSFILVNILPKMFILKSWKLKKEHIRVVAVYLAQFNVNYEINVKNRKKVYQIWLKLNGCEQPFFSRAYNLNDKSGFSIPDFYVDEHYTTLKLLTRDRNSYRPAKSIGLNVALTVKITKTDDRTQASMMTELWLSNSNSLVWYSNTHPFFHHVMCVIHFNIFKRAHF